MDDETKVTKTEVTRKAKAARGDDAVKEVGSPAQMKAHYSNRTGELRIKLTNDYLFKALLQKNEGVRKALVCALLHLEESEVQSLEVTNPIILGERVDEKDIYLDVNVRFKDGSKVDLEMQVIDEKNWPERSLYYACQNYAHLNKGDDYDKVKPAYQIGFLDFTLFEEHPDFYSTYLLMESKRHYIYTHKFMIGVVDLNKISLATEEDRKYRIDEWAKLFKAETWEEIKMLAVENADIANAAETIFELSENERIRLQCEAREDYNKRRRSMIRRLNEAKQQLVEQDKQLKDQDKQLKDQEELLKEKDKRLDESARILSEKDQRIAELEAKLAAVNEKV